MLLATDVNNSKFLSENAWTMSVDIGETDDTAGATDISEEISDIEEQVTPETQVSAVVCFESN